MLQAEQRCSAVSTGDESQRARNWKLLGENGKGKTKKGWGRTTEKYRGMKVLGSGWFSPSLHLIANVVAS